MMNDFWRFFGLVCLVNLLLVPAPRSTDFEVHRHWLALTYSLPLDQWYSDTSSQWTLDYPPFFAYLEWLLSHVAKYVDSNMLLLDNHNYASELTIWFQRSSVVTLDILYAFGVLRCINALKIKKETPQRMATELVLLWNVGLVFIDHIHFQYNGFLFGIFLLSISYLLEDRILISALLFSILLNFKHIFLYVAPAFGVYFLKFYCLKDGVINLLNFVKIFAVGMIPFVLSFGPFYKQLPQVFSRLFPFGRGLTHAYWAPNFWAVYNAADKFASLILVKRRDSEVGYTSGLVQQYKHVVLPTITPSVTFALTVLFMLPCLIYLCCYTEKRHRHKIFMRSTVLCSCAAFVFGWHVHEKAILITLIPLGLLSMTELVEAKFTYQLSIAGLFSFFPLLYHVDLILIRYALYMFYICGMYGQILRVFNAPPGLNLYETIYSFGFLGLPIYEHVFDWLLGFNKKYPFMLLLLTSVYCSIGIMYFFIMYYIRMFDFLHYFKQKNVTKHKTKLKSKTKSKVKTK